jgi:GrpB-like predicted nucleotidyltransferase (UPF0157 family)
VPDLEAAGFLLAIREPEWLEHRLPGDRRARDHLRRDAADRARYAAVKRELAAREWTYTQQYADAETEVVREIMARAERA